MLKDYQNKAVLAEMKRQVNAAAKITRAGLQVQCIMVRFL